MKLLLFFLCSFLCLHLHANNILVEKKGNITNYRNSEDVVSYSSYKDNPEFIAELSKKYNGLKDKKKLDNLLKKQNYIEVLNYLWTEPNAEKRLVWLEEKVEEGHPPLMFELGEEYYVQTPTFDTFKMKTAPWFFAGIVRVAIDAKCTSDTSVSAAVEALSFIYQTRVLRALQKNHSEEEFQKFWNSSTPEAINTKREIIKKVLNPFIEEKKKNPSPCWVFSHGMYSFTKRKSTIPETQYNSIRKKEAEECIKLVDELIESVGSASHS